jgi:hypothetical protein
LKINFTAQDDPERISLFKNTGLIEEFWEKKGHIGLPLPLALFSSTGLHNTENNYL